MMVVTDAGDLALGPEHKDTAGTTRSPELTRHSAGASIKLDTGNFSRAKGVQVEDVVQIASVLGKAINEDGHRTI